MNSKRPNLVERAAAQLLKSGNLDRSIGQLLGSDRTAKRPDDVADRSPRIETHSSSAGFDAGRQALEGTRPQSDDPVLVNEELATASLQTPLAAPAIIQDQTRVIDIEALQRAGMIDWSQARSRISEEFRVVQRQVLRNSTLPDVVEQGNANLIMMTSARPGEGKSFISLNLASGIARQRDHDVLLVDIDYKQDSIGTALGLAGARGLLDLVTDPALDPDEVIVRTGLNNLSFLPIGLHAERSPELFASRQATRLLQSLGRRYADRLVVMDAPPCLATSEPGVLASIAGQIVLVVEAEKTQREEVEVAMDLVHTCPTITLLLNKVQVSSRYAFGAYASSYSLPYSS